MKSLLLVGFAILATTVANAAPVVVNGDFEGNGAGYNPNANTFKTPITNWTAIGDNSGFQYVGIMHAGDAFTSGKDNSTEFAGMRYGRGISQTVSGFSEGQNYVVTFRSTARSGQAYLSIDANGYNIYHDVTASGNAFVTSTTYVFKATATNMDITIATIDTGDLTALIDDVDVVPSTNEIKAYAIGANFQIVDPSQLNIQFTGSPALGASGAYGITAYEGNSFLIMQFAGTATMTFRLLRPGWIYTVTYATIERNGYPPNDFQVLLDGTIYVGGVGHVSTTSWSEESFVFTASNVTAALTFQSLYTGGGDRTVAFDDVRITGVPGPVVGTVLMIR